MHYWVVSAYLRSYSANERISIVFIMLSIVFLFVVHFQSFFASILDVKSINPFDNNLSAVRSVKSQLLRMDIQHSTLMNSSALQYSVLDVL